MTFLIEHLNNGYFAGTIARPEFYKELNDTKEANHFETHNEAVKTIFLLKRHHPDIGLVKIIEIYE